MLEELDTMGPTTTNYVAAATLFSSRGVVRRVAHGMHSGLRTLLGLAPLPDADRPKTEDPDETHQSIPEAPPPGDSSPPASER